MKHEGEILWRNEFPSHISKYLKEYRPDIIVITGHDAYYKKKGDKDNINNWNNSIYPSNDYNSILIKT